MKSIKKISNNDEKPAWTRKKNFGLYELYHTQKTEQINLFNGNPVIFQNNSNLKMTIKNIDVNLFIPQASSINLEKIAHYLSKILGVQNNIPDYANSSTQQILSKNYIFGKAYLLYYPFADYEGKIVKFDFIEEPKNKNFLKFTEDCLLHQHPEWILDETFISLGGLSSNPIRLSCSHARNLPPHSCICVAVYLLFDNDIQTHVKNVSLAVTQESTYNLRF